MDIWVVTCPYQTVRIYQGSPNEDDFTIPQFHNSYFQWRRDGSVKLKHKGTQKYLSVSGQQYNRPISGQMEVVGQSQSGGATDWKAVEGVYVSPQSKPIHDEF